MHGSTAPLLGPSRVLTTGTVGVHGDPTSRDSISSLDGHVLSTQRRFHPHDYVAFYSTEETGRIVSGVSGAETSLFGVDIHALVSLPS